MFGTKLSILDGFTRPNSSCSSTIFLSRNRTQFFQRFCSAKLYKFLADGFCLGKRHIAVQSGVVAAALWKMALLIQFSVSGELTSVCTLMHPADWPNTVIFSGSPPNAAIFSFTPFQCCDLVENRVVSASSDTALLGQPRMCQKSESTETVIDRNENHAAFAVSRSIKFGFVAEAVHKRAAVNPESNRQFFIHCICRCPDI